MDELISRQAVKELAHNQMREKYCGMALKEQRDFYIKLADSIIDLLPSEQPEPKKGEWIEKPHVHGVAYCSLCDYELHTNDTNFCPNCGADMRREQDEQGYNR